MTEDSESEPEARVQRYTQSILSGKWEDHLEMDCLAQLHDLHIVVVEADKMTVVNATRAPVVEDIHMGI